MGKQKIYTAVLSDITGVFDSVQDMRRWVVVFKALTRIVNDIANDPLDNRTMYDKYRTELNALQSTAALDYESALDIREEISTMWYGGWNVKSIIYAPVFTYEDVVRVVPDDVDMSVFQGEINPITWFAMDQYGQAI